MSLFGVFHLMEQDRRSIERDFCGGKLCGTAVTNALELGIDVGHIDVTLHLCFPVALLGRLVISLSINNVILTLKLFL